MHNKEQIKYLNRNKEFSIKRKKTCLNEKIIKTIVLF